MKSVSLLKITEDASVDITDKLIKDILKISDDDSNTYENISVKKSDPEVIEYIQVLRSYLA